MKKILLFVLFGGAYIWGLVHGYLVPVWTGWMIATGVLYILMHYLTLSWREAIHNNGWIIGIFIAGMTGLIIRQTGNIWLGISALLWHGALWSVVHSLEESLSNRRKFKMTEFFQTGGVLFSIFFTLSFITAFIGRNQQFTLTCDDITSASTKIVTFTQEKFNISIHEIGNIFTFNNNQEKPTPSEVSGTDATVDSGSIRGMLQIYKQQLIDETVFNQKNVSQKVCQVFLDQIQELYEKPGFRVSVILLMFLVISPLLRITLYIISAINMLVFLLFKKMGIYAIAKETVEVDKVV